VFKGLKLFTEQHSTMRRGMCTDLGVCGQEWTCDCVCSLTLAVSQHYKMCRD